MKSLKRFAALLPTRRPHRCLVILIMERIFTLYTSEARSRVMYLFNIEVLLVTSWTGDNLRRRFYYCGLYKIRNNVYRSGYVMVYLLIFFVILGMQVTGRKGYNYFECHDPVANSRQKMIIVALMKKVDELKLREKDMQTKISDMKMKGKFQGLDWFFLGSIFACWCFYYVAEECNCLLVFFSWVSTNGSDLAPLCFDYVIIQEESNVDKLVFCNLYIVIAEWLC